MHSLSAHQPRRRCREIRGYRCYQSGPLWNFDSHAPHLFIAQPRRSPPPFSFTSSFRYEIMGIPIKHQPTHSTSNVLQTRGDRKCVSRNSTFGLPFPDEGGGSLSLSPSRQGKSKSSKRGLKDRKLRVLAVDRKRWIVSPSPTSPSPTPSSRFSLSLSFSLRNFSRLSPRLRSSPRFVGEIREIKRSPRHTHRNVISVYVSSSSTPENGAYASENAHEFPGRCLRKIVPRLTDFYFPCTSPWKIETRRNGFQSSNAPGFIQKKW